MSEHITIEISDISNTKIDMSNNNLFVNDLSLIQHETKQISRKMSVYKKFKSFIKKKTNHDIERGFKKWKHNSDLKGKPRVYYYIKKQKNAMILKKLIVILITLIL